jgi:predicted subunit of tRNA(5-methylaminomethyl-2-thiouridylate) methyltransferase
VEHAPEMSDCQDLSQAHRVVADGLRFDDSVPLINHDNIKHINAHNYKHIVQYHNIFQTYIIRKVNV